MGVATQRNINNGPNIFEGKGELNFLGEGGVIKKNGDFDFDSHVRRSGNLAGFLSFYLDLSLTVSDMIGKQSRDKFHVIGCQSVYFLRTRI